MLCIMCMCICTRICDSPQWMCGIRSFVVVTTLITKMDKKEHGKMVCTLFVVGIFNKSLAFSLCLFSRLRNCCQHKNQQNTQKHPKQHNARIILRIKRGRERKCVCVWEREEKWIRSIVCNCFFVCLRCSNVQLAHQSTKFNGCVQLCFATLFSVCVASVKRSDHTRRKKYDSHNSFVAASKQHMDPKRKATPSTITEMNEKRRDQSLSS